MDRRLNTLSVTDILFFAFSCVYLMAEFAFNARLLDVAGSAAVDDGEIHRVADFGRVVSGFGFTLLALGLFARARFRLTHKREKITFAVFASACLLPFVLFPPDQQEMLLIMPIAFGLFLMAVSRGRFAFHTILSVCLMAWPAMYAGQKSMIEHLVVEPTTWQERQHARNVLMLKAGLEGCVVEVEDKWLCQGDKSTAEVRAVRAMIAALWMHNPDAIINALEPQRDKIIEKTVRSTGDGAMAGAYKAYADKVKAERDKMVDQLIAQFYTPYSNASKAYMTAKDPAKLAAEVDAIWQDMERETDVAWNDYIDAQRQYQSTIGRASDTMLTRNGWVFEKLDEFCATRNCPRGNADRATLRLTDEAETQFIRKTGFPPNVLSKAELMTYARARDAFEDKVNAKLAAKTGLPDAALPGDWVYDERYIKAVLTQMMQNRVFTEWRKKFGDLPAGLPVDDFFIRMKVPPVPALDTLVMDEAAFAETYTLPKLRENMRGTLDQLAREAPLYANGQDLEAKGKNYIRAVYVPAIALLLSLLIVTLTLMRGLNAALRVGLRMLAENGGIATLKRQGIAGQRRMRHAIMAVVFALIAVLPFMLHNSYTQAKTYDVYVAEAARENIVTAALLNWAIHVQPMVYGAVRPLMRD